MANEVGPVERNMSNGGPASGDGRMLSLNGVRYLKGLGGHAPSAIEVRPSGACSTFTADIGVDDEAGGQGSVLFQIWGDGQKLFESGVMTGTTPAGKVNVSISGWHSLRFELVAVDTTNYDSADWANARIACPTIPNAPPQARFTTSASHVKPGDQVTFDAGASTDPDGTIRSYGWDFGDRTTANGSVVQHAYGQSGQFIVVLTVVDDKGASASATASIEVSVASPPSSSPNAAFSTSPSAAFPGVPIRFDASNSTDSQGRIVSYAWDFGDGGKSAGRVVSHAYVGKGIFTVRLVVQDDLGMTNETKNTIAIGNRPPSILSTSPEPNVVLGVSEPRTFLVVAMDPDGDPLTFTWAIAGGRTTESSSSYTFMSAVPGTYIVRVIASDGAAAVSFAWHIDVREGTTTLPPPSADLSGTLASVGVITIAVIVSVVVHALRLRKGR
jgi:PKD repeat protein